MKSNRVIIEAHILETVVQHGETFHVQKQHVPSGLIGKATVAGSLPQARLQARENLQQLLDNRWLPERNT